MDESLKQLIGVVIAIFVGAFLIVYVRGSFREKIENAIDNHIDTIPFAQYSYVENGSTV